MLLQAATKATRAAQFKVDASYDTPQYATLVACDCETKMSELRCEIGPPDSMQYPDITDGERFSLPHDRYDLDMALKALEITQHIVESCERFVNNGVEFSDDFE